MDDALREESVGEDKGEESDKTEGQGCIRERRWLTSEDQ
jgi:hypothetical protein